MIVIKIGDLMAGTREILVRCWRDTGKILAPYWPDTG